MERSRHQQHTSTTPALPGGDVLEPWGWLRDISSCEGDVMGAKRGLAITGEGTQNTTESITVLLCVRVVPLCLTHCRQVWSAQRSMSHKEECEMGPAKGN